MDGDTFVIIDNVGDSYHREKIELSEENPNAMVIGQFRSIPIENVAIILVLNGNYETMARFVNVINR